MAAILDFQSERFSYFRSINHSDASYQVPSQLAFGFRRKSEKKKKNSSCHHGGHLGFPISRILAIFDLQVTLILPTKSEVSWPFGSGIEGKIDFQDGGSRRRSEK